jgi:hypothetical protein
LVIGNGEWGIRNWESGRKEKDKLEFGKNEEGEEEDEKNKNRKKYNWAMGIL